MRDFASVRVGSQPSEREPDVVILSKPDIYDSLGDVQRALRARFPERPILVATVSNGWRPGYLPTAETYGKGIYQESIAIAAPGSLEMLIDAIGDEIAACGNG